MTPEFPEKSVPVIIETIDRLPIFWDRNVAFVANLLGLFFGNEEETRMLAETVGEVDSYGGRLLPILDLLFAGTGSNLLVLEREPDAFLTDFFATRAGLTLPEIFVLPHADYLSLRGEPAGGEHPVIERLRGHAAGHLDGYVTDDTLQALAERVGKDTLSTVPGSRRGNNKWLLHQHLAAAGLPVPPTEEALTPGDLAACLARLQRAGFGSAVIKAPLGASGIGLIKVRDLDDCDDIPAQVPEHLFSEGPCLVQAWLKPGEFGVTSVRSPSVQLFLNEDSVAMYDVTEQILSQHSVHEGNESPPPYLAARPAWRTELLRQAAVAGTWLHQQGFRGTASADFLLTETADGGFQVYVCELNARVTGATYPSVLARRFLPGGAWLLRNLRFLEPMTGRDLLQRLEDSNDLFLPGSERGVFPINFNFGTDGLIHKGQFLCLAPSSATSHELLHLAEFDLPCIHDRD